MKCTQAHRVTQHYIVRQRLFDIFISPTLSQRRQADSKQWHHKYKNYKEWCECLSAKGICVPVHHLPILL